jgi:hypothetical protein
LEKESLDTPQGEANRAIWRRGIERVLLAVNRRQRGCTEDKRTDVFSVNVAHLGISQVISVISARMIPVLTIGVP